MSVVTMERERRLLQRLIAVGGLIPVTAGLWGVLFGAAGLTGDRMSISGDSHYRYLSGLLLGLGIVFWSTIPSIEHKGARIQWATAIVVAGRIGPARRAVRHRAAVAVDAGRARDGTCRHPAHLPLAVSHRPRRAGPRPGRGPASNGNRSMTRAVIFDIEGTIIDSVDLHADAWLEALARFDIDVERSDLRRQIGKGADQLLPRFVPTEILALHGPEIVSVAVGPVQAPLPAASKTLSARPGPVPQAQEHRPDHRPRLLRQGRGDRDVCRDGGHPRPGRSQGLGRRPRAFQIDRRHFPGCPRQDRPRRTAGCDRRGRHRMGCDRGPTSRPANRGGPDRRRTGGRTPQGWRRGCLRRFGRYSSKTRNISPCRVRTDVLRDLISQVQKKNILTR